MGRPIITTDANGCRETVQDGVNGMLVKPKNVDGLVQIMNKFIVEENRLDVFGTASRRITEGKYDVKIINKQIFKILFDS